MFGPAVRRWYGHRPERYPEFASRYEQELSDPTVAAAVKVIIAIDGPVMLVTASRDVEHSHLPVLARLLNAAPEQPAA